ncbi:MAG: biopolymer transporter ExbD [Mariprofundaceae bacterium]|nr:biopolymer transporter ExbD [Mariprofundaceae bacterium]
MQFEGARRSGQAPNLTPLIDIVFLLLIFFLLTSNFIREQRLDIDLPQASTSQAIDQDEQLEIRLDADNRIYLRDEPVSLENLLVTLSAVLRSREHKQVQLRGDERADLMHVVAILDTARKAGASGVDIVTEKP